MPGGETQLLFVGSQGLYLVGNPTMSYFKAVFKRHTNFSTESIQIPFITKPVLTQSTRTLVSATISRNGDLIKDIFLVFTLPNIYSDKELRFQWIPKIGNYIIHSYSLIVGGQRIDQRYGDWLDVWNELTLPADKASMYNKMIGHVPAIYAPRDPDPIYDVDGNNLVFQYYPVGSSGSPSILERKVYVPLQFFFTRNPSLAIPLVALMYHPVVVEVEFQPLSHIYQVYDKVNNIYISPLEYQSRFGLDASIGQFLTWDQNNVPVSAVDINAYLEVNFVFLGNEERKKIAATPQQDYLIEQVFRYENNGLYDANVMNLTINNPVKEFVWYTRRSDMYKYNNWANFTNSVLEDEEKPILKSGKLTFNGVDRFAEKDAEFFQLLQPYMHHTRSPKQGIYCYSFSLYPERGIQPSGFINCSLVSRIQMTANMQPRSSTDYEYDIVLFSLSHNIFRVMGGMGGIVFS